MFLKWFMKSRIGILPTITRLLCNPPASSTWAKQQQKKRFCYLSFFGSWKWPRLAQAWVWRLHQQQQSHSLEPCHQSQIVTHMSSKTGFWSTPHAFWGCKNSIDLYEGCSAITSADGEQEQYVRLEATWIPKAFCTSLKGQIVACLQDL